MTEFDPKASVDLHQGAITTLACWLAALLAFALHLNHPWWSVISAWVVSNPERHALLQKAAHRILGTVIGCATGYWFALWTEGRPFLQMVAMFVTAATGTYGRYRSAYSYAWIIGAAVGLMILSTSLEAPEQIYHLAVFRAVEVICGVVAATFTEALFYRQRSPIGSINPRIEKAAKTIVSTTDHATALDLATVGGVAIICIPLLWSWLHLPSLTQIVISSLVVLDRDMASTHFRGLQRILGCFAGGAFGLLTIRLGPDSFFIWSIMLIAGIFLFSLLHHSDSRWSYSGTQGGVAFILALVTGSGPPDSMMPAVNRIAGMLCGVVILLIVSFVFGLARGSRSQVQGQTKHAE